MREGEKLTGETLREGHTRPGKTYFAAREEGTIAIGRWSLRGVDIWGLHQHVNEAEVVRQVGSAPVGIQRLLTGDSQFPEIFLQPIEKSQEDLAGKIHDGES